MTDPIYNVLFICRGNSARSIFGETLLNRWGRGRFRAFSAGSHPKGTVHPTALELLDRYGFPTANLRSKGFSEFEGPTSPPLDFVFTVCDNAAAEVCPAWPGQPMTAHWGVEDPAAVKGTDAAKLQAFRHAFHTLEARIRLFVSLPIAGLERIRLKTRLDEIGHASADATASSEVPGKAS